MSSSLLDDVDKNCNELVEEAVWATALHVRLQNDLGITIRWRTKGRPSHGITFPVTTPDTIPEVHRRVFSTLARIMGENSLSNVIGVHVELPRGVDGRNPTQTTAMIPFLQSIANSSTIQWLRSSVRRFNEDSARMTASHGIDATEPTDGIRLFLAAATNLSLPQSALHKLYLDAIHFDNDLLATLCEPLSTSQCQLFKLKFDGCRFPTLGPLWSALGTNQSISSLGFTRLGLEGEALGDIYGSQQLRAMLETNTTITELEMRFVESKFPNSFFAAVGAGLSSNTAFKTLDLLGGYPSERGYITALFEGGLDCNIGLEKLCLKLNNWGDAQDFVWGVDQMAKNISTQRSVDGSHRVSTIKKLSLHFDSGCHNTECFKLVLDCLVRNSDYYALKELHSESVGLVHPVHDASLFVKLAAFIQAFPTATVLRLCGYRINTHDSNLSVLADALDNNTTMIEFEICIIRATANFGQRNEWSPTNHPNRIRIVCSVVRNRRELPMFLESYKTSLLPLVLKRLLEPKESETEQVVNLNHAFHLVRNIPELFSTYSSGRDGGGGGEKVDFVAH